MYSLRPLPPMTGPSVSLPLGALPTLLIAGWRLVYISSALACGGRSAQRLKHPGDLTRLAEQHLYQQLFLSLQSLEELSQ